MWYRRHECGFRIALFFSAATAAGAFGGLISRGISEMDGFGNMAGWSWIFILEGLLSLVVGGLSHIFINDYPATAKFLSTYERDEVNRRLLDDDGLSDEFHIKFLYQALRDKKIWVMMFITIGIFTPMYSISLFLPTIITQFGYSANKSQLLTVPPYLAACLCTILGNYAADKFRQRGLFLLGFEVVAVIGFLMLVTNDMPHVQYLGFFFAASGIYPLVPLITTWTSNNIGGSLKRGVGIAMQVGFGNLGGVIAGFVYLSKDQPRFVTGHVILISSVSMSFVLTLSMTIFYRRENARRDAISATQNLTTESFNDELKLAERDKGDNALFFRYTV
ncbi:putative high-affinity nicotinic acid transporter [Erysiphe necator]|uniref:Putative high-affinity nicotinic acid transporter n=1 Tax=Uncinula necator TaxID=52586 RepID=A0A0B1PBA4_UNCNE|nr:putative high-affinity nicotinic acid transporter [Erysiphe necator]